ncbi:hypothetical protein JOD47_003443 [Arthrobacter tumbae]|nr:hypothetical protein [Arthrobacter tumbae]
MPEEARCAAGMVCACGTSLITSRVKC